MGLLDRLWGRTLSPEALRIELVALTEGGRWPELQGACARHRDVILHHAPEWWVTADPRSPDARAAWAVSRIFSESFEDRRLIDLLGSPARETIASRWERALENARRMMERMDYGGAERSLLSLLKEVRESPGPSALVHEAIALGALGRARFGGGYPQEALEPWSRALSLAEAAGDEEGVMAHLLSLYEAYRYLGDQASAARFANQAADRYARLGLTVRARYYRRQARRVREGEPLVEVRFEVDGLAHRPKDPINPEDPSLRPVYHRNRPSIPLAVQLVQRGKGLASSGDMGEGLALFRRAARVDPLDPDPPYQEGVCLMDMGRFDEAREAYDRAEALGPGWFHCRTNRWFAKLLSDGSISYEIYARLRLMADRSRSSRDRIAERAQEGEALVTLRPDLAPLWFHYGRALLNAGRPNEAKAAYRRGLKVAQEPDIKTRLLLEAAGLASDPSRGRKLLLATRKLRGNLIAAAMADLALALSALEA